MVGGSGLSRAAAHPLPDLTRDPASADLPEMGWLDEVVGDARVVAIGESAHFDAESFRLRHLILRRLVEHHGFTAYAMESGFAEGWRVHEWLTAEGHGADESGMGHVLAHGITSLMGMWAEQRDLMRWLRTQRDRVRFYGVDVPGSGVSLMPAIDLVTRYLARNDPSLSIDDTLRELAALGSATSVFAAQAPLERYVALTPERRDALTAGLSLLLARMRARRRQSLGARASPEGASRETASGADRAEHALETAIALDAYRRDATVNIRDLAQADTVEWILRREDRVVFAAHNAHVQRWPQEFPGVLPPTATAGQHLHDRLGDMYRVIGMTTGSGSTLATGEDFLTGAFFEPLPDPPVGTVDAVMAATHSEPFAVNLRQLGDRDSALLAQAREQRSGAFLCPIDPIAAYDAIVHLPHVSPARPDPEAVAAADPQVGAVFRHFMKI